MEEYLSQKLSTLYEKAPRLRISGGDRIVIFSDLHMGDGGHGDDFRSTSNPFKSILERHYFDRGFKLILNGDVEDLHKFIMKRVFQKWESVYDIFNRFLEETSLYKMLGNHDWDAFMQFPHNLGIKHYNTMKMEHPEGNLFFLHGHQASPFIEKLTSLNRLVASKIQVPLGVSNLSLKIDKTNIRPIERRLSNLSLREGALTFMGHTHKPHFGYLTGMPGIFNSGCVIGNKGFSALEIENNRISLIHWIDSKMLRYYYKVRDLSSLKLKGIDAYRMVLDTEPIRNIFRSLKCARTVA